MFIMFEYNFDSKEFALIVLSVLSRIDFVTNLLNGLPQSETVRANYESELSSLRALYSKLTCSHEKETLS